MSNSLSDKVNNMYIKFHKNVDLKLKQILPSLITEYNQSIIEEIKPDIEAYIDNVKTFSKDYQDFTVDVITDELDQKSSRLIQTVLDSTKYSKNTNKQEEQDKFNEFRDRNIAYNDYFTLVEGLKGRVKHQYVQKINDQFQYNKRLSKFIK